MKRLSCSWGKRKCDYCFKPTDEYTLDAGGWRVCKKCKRSKEIEAGITRHEQHTWTEGESK